jgi:hypothetical protein
MPSILPVTLEEGRACKRPRFLPNPLSPRQPLSLTNKHRRPGMGLQRSANGQIFKSPGSPRSWPKPFDPFALPYIPPVSFYES